jgi:CDP-diacylglycerol--glycerol-3-phosphate 3-phosphatidyltransferase
MKKAIPNLLTGGRLVLTLGVLICLSAAGGAIPFVSVDDATKLVVENVAFLAFVFAAVTDFFDGWLARRWNVVSLLGAILDPIADKVLVAAAIVGLVATGQRAAALPGGLILFREFSVSALRETLAPRGLRLPVTLLAKWKTTVQLVALAVMLFLPVWGDWGLPCDPAVQGAASKVAAALMWLAALITVWTGVEYALSARKALKEQPRSVS